MKFFKFTFAIFFATLVLNGALVTPTAHAQAAKPAASAATPAAPAASPPAAADTANSQLAASTGTSCGWWSVFSSPVFCGLDAVGYAIFSLTNGLLAIVGWFFNIVIQKMVFGYGNYFGASAGLLAGWGVLRDVANIALLFGFIFIGIATILDIHGYEAKKTLPRLIIFAVLLNFSLLASQGIIDVSNVFASTLYGQTTQCTGTVGDQSSCAANLGISGMIMSASGAGSIYSTSNTSPGFMFYMGLSIFTVILMVVLLAGAILLVVRGIVLAFLMILSPIGFAGLAIPPLEKYAKMWWDKLLSQSFFAPVFLLLMFIGLKIGATLGANGSLANALSGGSADAIDEILIFALVIGFMIAALMAAKQMGAIGANMAISASRKVVTYPFALLGRETVGRGASGLGKWYDTKQGQWISKDNPNRFTRGLARTTRFLGVDEGIAAGLKATAGAKIGGYSSFTDRQKEIGERDKATMHAAEIAELVEAIKTNNDPLAEKLAQKMNMHGIEEAILRMNDTQLAKFGEILSADKYEKVQDNKDISPAAQHSMAHGRFGSYDGLTTAGIAAMTPAAQDDLQKRLRAMGTKDAELLARYDSELFKEIADASNSKKESLFNDEQNKAIAKTDKVSKTARTAAKQNTRAGRVEEWAAGNAATAATRTDAKTLFKGMQGDAQAEVKADVIVTHLIDEVDVDGAQAIVAGNKFNRAQLDKLATSWKGTTDPAKKVRVANFSIKNGLASAVIGI